MRTLLLAITGAALGAAVLAAPSGASAHAVLEKAAPPVGGAVAAPPREVRLTFSEGVEPALSGLALTDEAGEEVAVGRPARDPKDDAVLVAPLPSPLSAGTYTVRWHAVSADTHRTRGSFTFTVGP